jgi:DNA polymerase V
MYSININPEIPVPVSAIEANLPRFDAVVHAGFPSPAADYAHQRVDLNAHLLRNREATFLFKVRGDSMVGVGIYDGDTLIVDKSITPAHHHIVLAIVDDAFTVKRLYMRDGIVKLLPENPAYAPICPADGQELRVWGVATFNLRDLLHS